MSKKWSTLLALALGASLIIGGCGTTPDAGNKAQNDGAKTSKATLEKKIIGIDPGAGLMQASAKALQEYGLDGWELVEGSGAAMTAALKKAYDQKEPIIITGWTPHWMFSKFDLKYLDDPKNVFGGAEDINTIARKGLKEAQPGAYAFLDNFNWTPSDMESVMSAVSDGKKPEEAAADWVKNNDDKVSKWIEGIDKTSGQTIKLAFVAWDSEIASTYVVKTVLEQKLGYQVELSQVEAGPMWAGIAAGDADAMVAAWLPTTHADYYKKFEGKFDDLGPNLKGTKIGWVVPAYMDIKSIEDLKK